MTTFEQRLASVDLTPFKTPQIKEQTLELLLKQIWKYQKFKRKVILQKINRMGYAENTVARYINEVKHYVLNGTPTSYKCGDKVYEVIDNLKAKHEPILTPSEQDKARIYSPRKCQPKPVTARTVEPPKYTEIIPDQYGVKMNNVIKLFTNKEACEAYIECYKEFNTDTIQLVKVEFEVV